MIEAFVYFVYHDLLRRYQSGKVWDLRHVDIEKLKAEFKTQPYKHIEIADLRAFIEDKLEKMLQENGSRADFAQRLQ